MTEAPSWRAWPELGEISKLDSSIASKALAGTVLSSLSSEDGQAGLASAQKCQLGPLSSRISPYCCRARRTTWAWGEYPEMSKLSFSRNRAPIGGRSGLLADPSPAVAGQMYEVSVVSA